jgi:hypothetical protein
VGWPDGVPCPPTRISAEPVHAPWVRPVRHGGDGMVDHVSLWIEYASARLSHHRRSLKRPQQVTDR